MISNCAFGGTSNHLQIFQSKFPYGLLGDDYGILTISDLAINACRFKPKPFPPEPLITPYEYWRCFESGSISFKCSGNGVLDDHEGIMGLIVVKASADQTQYRYIERRPIPIRECRSFLKELRLVLKGTSHVCVSGSFINNETEAVKGKTSSWLFERLKTSKGCVGRGCDFTEKIMKENCPDLKL